MSKHEKQVSKFNPGKTKFDKGKGQKWKLETKKQKNI